MKKFFLLFSILILISCTKNHVGYFDDDYNNVFKIAHQENKMVFIDFFTYWCGPCKLFEKNIVSDTSFKDYITSNFYTTKINAEIEENKKIVRKYNITGYPTFIITKPNGDEIDRIVGLTIKDSKEFIDLIKNVTNGNDQLSDLKGKYLKDPDNLDLFRKIMQEKLLSKDLYSDAIELSESAFE